MFFTEGHIQEGMANDGTVTNGDPIRVRHGDILPILQIIKLSPRLCGHEETAISAHVLNKDVLVQLRRVGTQL